jgi:hypothetical protein
MSKAKLIELIKLDHRDLMVKLNDMSRFGEDVIEFQNILRQALKDQDRDTRHGCAEMMLNQPQGKINWAVARQRCLNYKDKDLVGL